MKKLKMALIACVCLCLALMSGVMLVACDNEEPKEFNPYIKVSGLSTACIVGDELDYSNAKILYYENLTDETPDEIALTRDMVTGFSSDESGTRTLKVNYKTYTTEVDYNVVSEEKFKEIFANATTKMYSTTNAKFVYSNTQEINDTVMEINGTILVEGVNIYMDFNKHHMIGEFKSWYILDPSITDGVYCFNMIKPNELYSEIMGITGDVNEVKFAGEDFKPSEVIKSYASSGITEAFIDNSLDEVIDCRYSKFNGKEFLTIDFIMNGFYSSQIVEIDNSKITNISMNVGGIMEDTLNVLYNVNEEIPAIPENFEFEIGAAEVIDAYETAINRLEFKNELTLNCKMVENSLEKNFAAYFNGEVFYMEEELSNNKRWVYENASYEISSGKYIKDTTPNNLSEYIIMHILGFSGVNISEVGLKDAKCTFKLVNGNAVYKFVKEENNLCEEITISNGLIVKTNLTFDNNKGYESVITYELNKVIPGLPNVQWEEE